jgi:hypothetical protein
MSKRNDIVAWRTVIEDKTIIQQYANYIKAYSDPTKTDTERKAIFDATESALASIQGATSVGKGNKKGVPDFQFSDELLIGGFKLTQAEAKLKRTKPRDSDKKPRSKTEIGSSVVTGSVIQQIKEAAIDLSDSYDREEIEKLLGSYTGAEISSLVKSNPELSKIFYEKSKFLQIFVQNTPSSPITAYNFVFSEAAFKSALFNIKWRKDKKKFITSLNNTYENKLLNQLQQLPAAINAKTIENFQTGLNKLSRGDKSIKKVKTSFDNLPLTISFYTGGSIPMSTSSIKYTSKPKRVLDTTQPSIIDVTILVKSKVKQRMRRGAGKPRPPKIYERTGTFRNSIRAYFNFKQRTVDYFYEPLYQRLERSGYEVDNLVEDSIRAVIQSKFREQAQTRRIEL